MAYGTPQKVVSIFHWSVTGLPGKSYAMLMAKINRPKHAAESYVSALDLISLLAPDSIVQSRRSNLLTITDMEM